MLVLSDSRSIVKILVLDVGLTTALLLNALVTGITHLQSKSQIMPAIDSGRSFSVHRSGPAVE